MLLEMECESGEILFQGDESFLGLPDDDDDDEEQQEEEEEHVLEGCLPRPNLGSVNSSFLDEVASIGLQRAKGAQQVRAMLNITKDDREMDGMMKDGAQVEGGNESCGCKTPSRATDDDSPPLHVSPVKGCYPGEYSGGTDEENGCLLYPSFKRRRGALGPEEKMADSSVLALCSNSCFAGKNNKYYLSGDHGHGGTDFNTSTLYGQAAKHSYSSEDGGMTDEEIEDFLGSRAKRGRGAVWSRLGEGGGEGVWSRLGKAGRGAVWSRLGKAGRGAVWSRLGEAGRPMSLSCPEVRRRRLQPPNPVETGLPMSPPSPGIRRRHLQPLNAVEAWRQGVLSSRDHWNKPF